ncbi:MAG: glycosyltransferase family 4 protein [bacterium]|nr:glycosyltransferase family 4 protein [bacterium]
MRIIPDMDKYSTKVLMVIPGQKMGATMVFAKRQADALREYGIDCRSFYMETGMSLGSIISQRRKLKKEIRDFSPDIVHANYGTMTGFLTTSVSPVPVLLHLRGSDLLAPQATLKARIGRLLSQLAALKAKKIICVAEHLKQSLWWGKSKVSIVPSGVDLQKFKPGLQSVARTELGWVPDQPVVVFNAGRDPRIKNLPLAEKTMNLVSKQIPEVRFFVMKGEVAPHTIPTIFQGADCLLLASKSEGSPNVVKEAMATNLPIVSTDVGDVAERLKNTSCSRVTGPHAEDLADAIISILVQNNRSNGREHVANLSLEKTTEMIAVIYNRMQDN